MENFSNNARSTLVSAIGGNDLTLTVQSAAGFPSPDFRILIDSELMLVTEVESATWTVTRAVEGTTAAGHSANATVAHVLTRQGLLNVIAENLDGTGISEVADDSSPTLGGNLTLDGHSVGGATATEVGYLSGVTSAIQTQLNSKAASSSLATVATSGAYNDLTGKPDLSTKQDTITGGATSITSSDLTASRALTSDGSGKVSASSVTSTELGYVAGVTSAVQTQLNAKQATISGGASTIVSSDLTASRALVSNGSGKVSTSSVTSTELGYVAGVTSAIQTQLNALSGGGGTIEIEFTAWVEADGNNGTAELGNPAKPYLTMQAAFNAGAKYFYLSEGTFTGIEYAGIINVSILGKGANRTTINGITATDGSTVYCRDLGMHSFFLSVVQSAGHANGTGGVVLNNVIAETIHAYGANGQDDTPNGRDAGAVTLTNCQVNGDINAYGGQGYSYAGSSSQQGGEGGNGSQFNAINTRIVGTVYAYGGNGGNGEPDDGSAGSGGDAGSITLLYSTVSAGLHVTAGSPGTWSGVGSAGAGGTAGSLSLRWSSIQELFADPSTGNEGNISSLFSWVGTISSGSPAIEQVQASKINGTWIE